MVLSLAKKQADDSGPRHANTLEDVEIGEQRPSCMSTAFSAQSQPTLLTMALINGTAINMKVCAPVGLRNITVMLDYQAATSQLVATHHPFS